MLMGAGYTGAVVPWFSDTEGCCFLVCQSRSFSGIFPLGSCGWRERNPGGLEVVRLHCGEASFGSLVHVVLFVDVLCCLLPGGFVWWYPIVVVIW